MSLDFVGHKFRNSINFTMFLIMTNCKDWPEQRNSFWNPRAEEMPLFSVATDKSTRDGMLEAIQPGNIRTMI